MSEPRGFRTARACGLAMMLGLAVVLVVPVQAEITVSGPFVDEDTQGDWRGTYGECFVLIPEPTTSFIEEPVGPDYFSAEHLQYRFNNCYEGPFFNNDPDKTQVDWRIFRNGEPPNAFAWHNEITVPDAAQWNPCRGEFYHATWDNDVFAADPLSIELTLWVEGDITLAFYFTNGATACREQDYTLEIDGTVSEGTISDFAAGKYVIFEISGLEMSDLGTPILFSSQDAPGVPSCPGGLEPDVNTHISGVFIGGECAPTTDCPECGNGILEDGEECDEGEQNGMPGSGCSAECTLVFEPDCSCEDGKPATLVFKYTGENCDASDNSQSSDSCRGELNGASPVYVEVLDGGTAVPGMVDLDGNVSIVATDDKLKSNTTIMLSHESGAWQEVNIHTSCSQDLEVGDQFGSLLLVEFIPEGGPGVCGGDDEGNDEGDDEQHEDVLRVLARPSLGDDSGSMSHFGAR